MEASLPLVFILCKFMQNEKCVSILSSFYEQASLMIADQGRLGFSLLKSEECKAKNGDYVLIITSKYDKRIFMMKWNDVQSNKKKKEKVGE